MRRACSESSQTISNCHQMKESNTGSLMNIFGVLKLGEISGFYSYLEKFISPSF